MKKLLAAGVLMEHKKDVYPKGFGDQLSFFVPEPPKPQQPCLEEKELNRGLFNDLAGHTQYRGKRGDLTDVKCPNCGYHEARIEMAYGPKMRVRCIRCKHAEIVCRAIAK